MLLRVVIDTNQYVSALLSTRGAAHELLATWEREQFHVVISTSQQFELARALLKPRFAARYAVGQQPINALFNRFSAQAAWVEPLASVPVEVRDVKDEHVLATALGGDADYLVTADNDLLVLDGDPRLGKLRIVTAPQFLRVLRATSES